MPPHTLERYGSGCCDGIQLPTGRGKADGPSPGFFIVFSCFFARARIMREAELSLFSGWLSLFSGLPPFFPVPSTYLPRAKHGRISVFSRISFTVDLPERREIWDKFQHKQSTVQRATKLAILTVRRVSAG